MELVREIYLAESRVSPFIYRTPLRRSLVLSDLLGLELFFKCENFQVTGSFKVRGAFNKFIKLREEGFNGKVVTVSTGNHGLAVAYASKVLGFDATVVLPENAVGFKVDRIKSMGVKVVFHGSDYDSAEEYARGLEEAGFLYISPYNDLDIIAGQGTIGLEIAVDMPAVDYVVVPVGGGGLISGIAAFLKSSIGSSKVIGVQSEASAPMYHSLREGKIVKVQLSPSIADGLHGNIEENSITFDFVRRFVDDVVVVGEDSIRDALRTLYKFEGLIVEGAAAVTLAAILEDKFEFRDSKTVLVLSGGNIDPEHLRILLD